MQNRNLGRIIILLLAILLLPSLGHAQSELDGVWVRGGGQGGRGGPMSQWSNNELPFTPEGRARFDANAPGKGPRQDFPALGNDPLGDSNPPGLYRTLVYNRPFEMIQLEDKVVQMFEWNKAWRTIWTDGRPVPDDIPAGPYWYGYSVGRWEGDTLIVETIGLDGRAWFDEWGTPFSDATHVEERWRRVDAENLELTLTVTDPGIYREPWTSSVANYSAQSKDSPNGELLEVIFAPIDEVRFNARIRNPAAGVPNP
jgi:hypothetical protein